MFVTLAVRLKLLNINLTARCCTISILGHYLLDSCFSSENLQDGMRSLPLPIIHILSFYYQNLVK